jgi:ubiquinone/menaquinone biosynthesis C-methylase UbiE
MNFQHYPMGARVIATEPDPYMLERARQRVAKASASIDLRQVSADALPFRDGAFDFVVSTLVLCSVQSPRKVLSEIKRVLKPGGELRLYEHVRYRNPVGGFAQDAITPLWKWIGAGCHPNRDTERSVRQAGFEVSYANVEMPHPPIPPMLFVRPHLRAVARRPA